jgi:hypothetical protein
LLLEFDFSTRDDDPKIEIFKVLQKIVEIIEVQKLLDEDGALFASI